MNEVFDRLWPSTFLRASGWYRISVFSLNNSILVGCQTSVSFARGLLWNLIDLLIHALPRNPPWEHVDDIAQPLVDTTSLGLRTKIVTAGTIVGKEVQRLQIKLSEKSVVVPMSAATRGAGIWAAVEANRSRLRGIRPKVAPLTKVPLPQSPEQSPEQSPHLLFS